MSKEKLFAWEGLKKEIFWIIFFIFLILMVFAYRADIKHVKELQQTECYQDCAFREGVKQKVELYPQLQFTCDYELRVCEVAGDVSTVNDEWINELISIQDDTNNTRTDSPKD